MVRHEDDEEDIIVPKKRRVVEDEDEPEPVQKKAKRKIEEDDEDEEPVKKKVKPVIEDDDEDEPAPKAKVKKKVVEDEEEDSIGMEMDIDDDRLVKRQGSIDRLNVEKESVARFAFIPGMKPRAAYVHYIDAKEGGGNFICNSTEHHIAECCKLFGSPDMKSTALVVHYTNAKSKDGGKPKNGEVEWAIKAIKMSPSNVNEIRSRRFEGETIYDFDYTMGRATNNNGYTFNKIAPTTWYRSDKEIEQEVLDAAEKFKDGKAMSRLLGRKLSDVEYKLKAKAIARAESRDDEDEA